MKLARVCGIIVAMMGLSAAAFTGATVRASVADLGIPATVVPVFSDDFTDTAGSGWSTFSGITATPSFGGTRNGQTVFQPGASNATALRVVNTSFRPLSIDDGPISIWTRIQVQSATGNAYNSFQFGLTGMATNVTGSKNINNGYVWAMVHPGTQTDSAFQTRSGSQSIGKIGDLPTDHYVNYRLDLSKNPAGSTYMLSLYMDTSGTGSSYSLLNTWNGIPASYLGTTGSQYGTFTTLDLGQRDNTKGLSTAADWFDAVAITQSIPGPTRPVSTAASGEAPKFVSGDRVVFIGDSITHAGGYVGFVYDFYLTRFPNSRVTCLNCGISGNTAWDVLGRMQWDILAKKPTRATIMLGMNDVSRDSYGTQPPTEEQLKKRQTALTSYRNNMRQVINQLEKENIRITLITPSPYDQTAQLPRQNQLGVNDALGVCCDFDKETAKHDGLGLIDFYTPMTALNAQYQKSNPAATLIGPDRIHPQQLGHLLMAYYFLKGQGMGPMVSSVTIDAAGGKLDEARGCTVRVLEASKNGVSYSYLADSLPFPVSEPYPAANSLVPLTSDLNVERISVHGLTEGRYDVLVDGTRIGECTAANLSGGINIAPNEVSPMQKQAQAVHAKNQQRVSYEQKLRTIAWLEPQLRKANVNPTDPTALDTYFAQMNEANKGKSNATWLAGQYKIYVEAKPREQEYSKLMAAMEDELYVLNKPVVHKVELKAK